MGSTRSERQLHWRHGQWPASFAGAAIACCLLIFASCATSKSKIAEETPVPQAAPAMPAATAAVGEKTIAPINSPQMSSALAPAGSQTTVPAHPSNSNSLRFVPPDALTSITDPTPPAAPSPTATCAQPIPASLPTVPQGAILPVSANVAYPQPAEDHSARAAGTAERPDGSFGGGLVPPQGDAKQAVADVLQYALAHHPALRARKSEVDAACARLITARLLPNPELMIQSASPTDGRSSSDMSTRLMFTVPLGPKRAWASAAAQSGIYAAQKSLSTETKNILLEAADAAIEVMYLREKGEIYEQLAQQSGQITAIQSESFKAAIVPYRNVVLAELAAYNLELDRRKTTAELNQARVRLARAMGIPNGSPPGLDGRLTFERTALPPLAAVLDRAGSVSPELAKTCGGIQQSRQEHQYERWNALPDISVGPRLEKDLGNSLNDELGARLQWDLPIFNRNQGNIAETAADIQTRCAEYEVARVTTLNDVAALYLELEDSQARGDYFQTRVRPLIEQSEQSLRTVFEDRAATAYELTKLMETLSRMKLSDLDLRHDHHRLRTRLEMLLECPLSSLGVGELPPLPPAGLGPAPIPPPQEAPVEQP